MKKLMMILIAVPICAFAGTDDTNEICRRNTLVMAVLRTDAETTALAKLDYLNNDTKHWKVDLGYDIFANMRPELGTDGVPYIYGSATCNGRDVRSSPDGKSNNYGSASFGDTNTFLKASVKDVGANCWCKMDWPVTSWWTYFKKYDTKQLCAEECTTYCAEKFTSNGELGTNTNSNKVVYGRDALYYTIW